MGSRVVVDVGMRQRRVRRPFLRSGDRQPHGIRAEVDGPQQAEQTEIPALRRRALQLKRPGSGLRIPDLYPTDVSAERQLREIRIERNAIDPLIRRLSSARVAHVEKLALAAQLGAGPTKGYADIKRAIYTSATNTLDAQLDLERYLQRELGKTADYREGVQAFLEKRAPKFSGR